MNITVTSTYYAKILFDKIERGSKVTCQVSIMFNCDYFKYDWFITNWQVIKPILFFIKHIFRGFHGYYGRGEFVTIILKALNNQFYCLSKEWREFRLVLIIGDFVTKKPINTL